VVREVQCVAQLLPRLPPVRGLEAETDPEDAWRRVGLGDGHQRITALTDSATWPTYCWARAAPPSPLPSASSTATPIQKGKTWSASLAMMPPYTSAAVNAFGVPRNQRDPSMRSSKRMNEAVPPGRVAAAAEER